MRSWIHIHCSCLVLALAPVSVNSAAIRDWAGQGTTGLWSDNLNWLGGVPAFGDGVAFPAGKPRLVNTNNLITGRFWSTVEINGSNYVIRGSAMELTNGFRADYLSGSSTFEPDLALFSRNQFLNVFQPNSTLIMNGDIILTNSVDLTLDVDGTMRMFGNFVGRGLLGMTSQGAGRVELYGANRYTNTIQLTGGTTWVHGSADSAVFQVDGTLGGGGSVGGVTLNAGTLDPGTNKPAVLTIRSNLFATSSSGTFRFRLNSTTPGSGYGQLSLPNSASTVNLGNATLEIALGFQPAIGDSFTLISKAGATHVTGTFNGRAEGSTFTLSGIVFQITYAGGDGNDVVLTVIDATSTWTGVSFTPFWSDKTNWANLFPPRDGYKVLFPATAGNRNGINDLTLSNYNRITFTDAGFVISGGVLPTSNGIVASHASGTNLLASPILLRASQTFSNANAGTMLSLVSGVTVSNNDLRLDGAGDFILLGAGPGSGAISKFGPGTLFKLGTNTATGPMLLAGGTMVLRNADLASQSSLILSNATLTGTGRVCGITLKSGAHLQPGDNVGRITVAGNLLATNGTISFDLNGTNAASQYDQLTVSGGITLTNVALDFSFGFDPPDGFTFILLNNTGSNSITGQFDGHPEGDEFDLPQMHCRITYRGGDGNDVALTVSDVSPGTIRQWNVDGASSLRWTDPNNWFGGAPTNGDTLVFPAATSGSRGASNDFPAGTTFGKIRLEPNPRTSGGNGQFIVSGNPIRLDRGITSANPNPSSDPHQFAFTLPIALNADQSFTNCYVNRAMTFRDLNLDGHTLTMAENLGGITVTGIVSGAGIGSRIFQTGPGLLTIQGGPHTYQGLTTILNGSLALNASLVSRVAINAPGQFGASGVVGGIDGIGGSMTVVGSLQSTGAVDFSSGFAVAFEVRRLPPSNDQLICNAGINLGNATLNLTVPLNPIQDTNYVLINKTSAGFVTGAFAGFAEGSEFLLSGHHYRITYRGGDSNDVAIIATNYPPTITAVTNRTVNEHFPLVITNIASDLDPADRLTFSLDPGAPTNSTINPINGVFSWTPSEEQGPGAFTITMRVTDNGLPAKSAATTFNVTVNDFNLPPVLQLGANFVSGGTNFSAQTNLIAVDELSPFTLPLAVNDAEGIATNFTFELLQGPVGLTLSSLSITSAVVNWTPTEEQGPSTNLMLLRVAEFSTNVVALTQAVSIVVNEINLTPTFQPIPGTNVLAGQPIVRPLLASDADVPTNALRFQLLTSIAGASISTNGTNVSFQWTPAANQIGQFNIRIRCFDTNPPAVNARSLSVTQEFLVNVGILRIVTNTNDSGPGSLRQAITEVNTNSSGGQIQFNIPGAGPHKIAPLTPLPPLTHATVIDGYTQPPDAHPNHLTNGNDARLLIELSGENIPNSTGLSFGGGFGTGQPTTIRGLCVNRFNTALNSGCRSCGGPTAGSVIEGCFLGTDPTGTLALPNGTGISYVQTFVARIGGPDAAQRNLISGNLFDAISLSAGDDGQFVFNLVIQNNYIGTDRTGTNALGNGRDGIVPVTGGVGGFGFAGHDCIIADNVIAANGGVGVRFGGSRNTLVRNKIGVGADGLTPLGNASHGLDLFTSDSAVGGPSVADANLIANNGGAGVHIGDGARTTVLGNSIFRNGGLAIDLAAIGPDGNDLGDGDGGPNDLQNKPVLTGADVSGSNGALISGTLSSGTNSSYRIEFFHSPDFAPNDRPQAQTFLGFTQVTTDGSGNANILVLATVPSTNGFITATATDAAGNTSEISPGVSLGAPPGGGYGAPQVRIARGTGDTVVVSWTPAPVNSDQPAIYPDYQLQVSEDLVLWSDFGPPVRGGVGADLPEQMVSLPAVGAQRSFRLQVSLNLSNANFAGQDLSGASFRNANLAGANLSGAILAGADLSGADLTGANLDGALLDGANLNGARVDSYRGEFLLHEVFGPAGDSVSVQIPDIGFVPRLADYALPHPTLPRFSISHNTLMVGFRPGITVASANSVLRSVGARIVGGIKGNTAGGGGGLLMIRLATANHQELSPLLANLQSNPNIAEAVADMVVEPTILPPFDADAAAPVWKWTLLPGGGNWGFEAFRVPQMWNFNPLVEQMGGDILTGIIDVGFCNDHPDISFFDRPSTIPQDHHGTYVASMIGATFGNRLGMEGVNPFARMIPRAAEGGFSTAGFCFDQIRQLAQMRALVINMSLGLNGNVPVEELPEWEPIEDREGNLFQQLMQSLGPAFSRPLIVVSAGNGANYDARHNSPWANAALRGLVENVLVVEALQFDLSGDTIVLSRAPYSSINGHVSASADRVTAAACAPAFYQNVASGGTSIATPFVTGLAGYLFKVDNELTPSQVAALIRANAIPVPGAAPHVDAWATVMDIDRIRGNKRVLRMMLDIDDGTLDGNQRFDPLTGTDFTTEETVLFPGEGPVNMADFRRWRDWLLEIENTPGLELDGSANHPKKDVNRDQKVDEFESVFPRGDFNGDGVLNRTNLAPVPGFLGGQPLTDLEVLALMFNDRDYSPGEIFDLIDSSDFEIDAFPLINNPQVAQVKSLVFLDDPANPVGEFTHSVDRPRFIYTVRTNAAPYTARVEARDGQGHLILQTNFPFQLNLGGDLSWTPTLPGAGRLLATGGDTDMDLHLVGSLRELKGPLTNRTLLRQKFDGPETVEHLTENAPPYGQHQATMTSNIFWGSSTFTASVTYEVGASGDVRGVKGKCTADFIGADSLVSQPDYFFFFIVSTRAKSSVDLQFTATGPFTVSGSFTGDAVFSIDGHLVGPGGDFNLDSRKGNLGLPGTTLPPGNYGLSVIIPGDDLAQQINTVSEKIQHFKGNCDWHISFQSVAP